MPLVLRLRFLLPVLAGAVLLSACASPPTTDLTALPPMPASVRVPNVPFYPQEDKYCGPASLAMVLSWSGTPVSQDEVADQVYTPGREGTLRADMLSAARRHGRLAVPVNAVPALLKELEAGHPVVVFQNRGLPIYPIWHYAVAIGYDLAREELILHSGTTAEHTLDLGAFERTWRRGDYWGLVVLPPGGLPASGDVWDVLAAAAALERTGHEAEADTTYALIAEQWPENWAVYFAQGNRRYNEADYEGAAAGYRRAVSLNPEAAEAWNNLASALTQLGQREAALEAARTAVSTADEEQRAAFQATLDELSE